MLTLKPQNYNKLKTHISNYKNKGKSFNELNTASQGPKPKTNYKKNYQQFSNPKQKKRTYSNSNQYKPFQNFQNQKRPQNFQQGLKEKQWYKRGSQNQNLQSIRGRFQKQKKTFWNKKRTYGFSKKPKGNRFSTPIPVNNLTDLGRELKRQDNLKSYEENGRSGFIYNLRGSTRSSFLHFNKKNRMYISGLKYAPIIGFNSRRGELRRERIAYSNSSLIHNWFGRSRFRFLKSLQESLGFYFETLKGAYYSVLNMKRRIYKKRKFSEYLIKKLSLLRMRLFYGVHSHKRFVRLLKDRASADHYQATLYSLMERRLDVLLFRIGFAHSIYSAQQIVKHGHVMVGKKIIRNFYYPIRFYQKVSFDCFLFAEKMKHKFLVQLLQRQLKFPFLKYLIFNIEYMHFYVRPIVDPLKEVPLSFNLHHRHLSIR